MTRINAGGNARHRASRILTLALQTFGQRRDQRHSSQRIEPSDSPAWTDTMLPTGSLFSTIQAARRMSLGK